MRKVELFHQPMVRIIESSTPACAANSSPSHKTVTGKLMMGETQSLKSTSNMLVNLDFVRGWPFENLKNGPGLELWIDIYRTYGANVWWGKFLTNQSCIVKIFPINILHLEYKKLSASTYNLWPRRACMRTEWGIEWQRVCLILHDQTTIYSDREIESGPVCM